MFNIQLTEAKQKCIQYLNALAQKVSMGTKSQNVVYETWDLTHYLLQINLLPNPRDAITSDNMIRT